MNSTTKQRRLHFTPEERGKWVLRFRSGGLTQVRFAEQNGLKLKTPQRWLYGRTAQAMKGKSSASVLENRSPRVDRTVVVVRRKSRRTPSATFREVKSPPLGPASVGWAAEVRWPSGVTVRLGAEPTWIGSLLGVVHQAC